MLQDSQADGYQHQEQRRQAEQRTRLGRRNFRLQRMLQDRHADDGYRSHDSENAKPARGVFGYAHVQPRLDCEVRCFAAQRSRPPGPQGLFAMEAF